MQTLALARLRDTSLEPIRDKVLQGRRLSFEDGLALYRTHRGERPVTGVVYTHSHADHFGGVLGVLPDGAGDVPIIAPAGFMEHAVSENVYAGVAMNRRANYMYGAILRQAMLFRCDLRGVNLASADLRGARMVGCQTAGADLDDAKL